MSPRRKPSLSLPPPTQQPQSALRRVPKRYLRLGGFVLVCLGLFSAHRLWWLLTRPRPPLYSQYHANELALLQHNPDLPYPEGRTGKYIWVSEHMHGAGFGNILQEHFMNGLLAYASGRSFVFNNYTWSRKGVYSDYNGKLIPAQIPMSAFISGPLVGGPLPPGDKNPRAVHKEYFDQVCPEVKLLDKWAVRATLSNDQYSAMTIMHAWLTMLEETPDRCVEIDDSVFDIWIFGTTRIHDILPALYESPMMKLFRWSPLVTETFKEIFPLDGPFGGSSADPYPVMPGLLALHIRRGDFETHCKKLADWHSSWSGLNQMPELLDRFEVPIADHRGKLSKEGKNAYQKSCYPSISQIVDKVMQVRRTEDGKQLKNIFIMTNGKPDWVLELREALREKGDWGFILSSRDVLLTPEQKYVSAAVDMLIGQRADVFIGNGFSSLTGNVVMLRAAKGMQSGRTRFW